jgi:hypothetical protein
MGSRQCSLSMTSLAPPLVGDSQEASHSSTKWNQLGPTTSLLSMFQLCSSCFTSLMFFVFHCYSSFCFATLLRASLFLSVLHYITPLCVSLLLMFWCSSSFVVVHHASLLLHGSLLLLHYYSLCFVVALCASLLLLLRYCSMFCYSCCFVVVWCFVVPTTLLLHGVSPLLYASLFYCPPRYLFAPCCFAALLFFIVVQFSLFPCLDW